MPFISALTGGGLNMGGLTGASNQYAQDSIDEETQLLQTEDSVQKSQTQAQIGQTVSSGAQNIGNMVAQHAQAEQGAQETIASRDADNTQKSAGNA